jgi:hypothetical protein
MFARQGTQMSVDQTTRNFIARVGAHHKEGKD